MEEYSKILWYASYSADSYSANLIEYESYELDGLIHARTKNSHFDAPSFSIQKLDKPVVSQPIPEEYFDYGDPDLILHAEMWSYSKERCIEFIEEQKQNYIKILNEHIKELQQEIEWTKFCVIKETDI